MEGKKRQNIYVDLDVYHATKMLSAHIDMSMGDIYSEGAKLMMEKYGTSLEELLAKREDIKK